MRLSKDKIRIHFVGVGGIGMSGLAELFYRDGYQITGSDLYKSDTTTKLEEIGIKITIGHDAKNVHGATVTVISSAVKKSNPEVLESIKLKIPVIPRAEMLGELMRGKTGIAVAGTHGKTTTTSLIGSILHHGGVDPTLVIGGRVDALGGNAKLGKSQYVVAEADESDGSFLHLPATYVVVTNIDDDHLDHYGSLRGLEDAFINFVNHIPFYGCAFICGDDPGIKKCREQFLKPCVTYGLSADSDCVAKNLNLSELGTEFDVEIRGQKYGRIKIPLYGKHNVLNTLAAILVGNELGLSIEQILTGLQSFSGVRRRFEVRYRSENNDRILIEDYGHHPTEIRSTLESVRQFWKGRVITIFQPHRYSRTKSCFDQFLDCFISTDVLWITDIYSAGEENIPGITSEVLAKAIHAKHPKLKVEYAGALEAVESRILSEMTTGDLVLCLGAGSISKLAQNLSTRLK